MSGPAHTPEPLKVGDRVALRVDGGVLPARIRVAGRWSHFVVRSDDGRLWIEVVMNLSAVSWTRLIELAADLDDTDAERFARIAEALSFKPRREDVADVPEALRLCAPADQVGERL